MKSKLFILLLLVFSISACDIFEYGIPESQFILSPESRLPKWVDIPLEYTRTDLTMKIGFYTHLIPFVSKAKMVVRGPAPEHKLIMVIAGNDRFHPQTKKQKWDVYPRHVIISVNGVEEVFEHRQRNNILHVTDDPKLTAVLNKE
jgi:hypothetical protein